MTKIDDSIYQFFADYIYDHTGIYYSPNDFYRLDSRLNALCEKFKKSNFKELHDLYKQSINNDMHSSLVDIATNNETYFLRDNNPFEALSKHLIPQILKNQSQVKIWSAGCSTGQEPYSIVMTAMENNPTLSGHDIHVTATDISKRALEKAQNGIYQQLEVQRGLPANMLLKYFDQLDSQKDWKIKNFVKKCVDFKEFNLFKDHFPKEQYDVIFCRNVIIYQTTENKRIIVNNLFHSLKEGGHLFLGSGESLIGTKVPYCQEKIGKSLIFRKETPKAQAA